MPLDSFVNVRQHRGSKMLYFPWESTFKCLLKNMKNNNILNNKLSKSIRNTLILSIKLLISSYILSASTPVAILYSFKHCPSPEFLVVLGQRSDCVI